MGSFRFVFSVVVVGASFALALTRQATAQDAPPPQPTLQERFDALDQKVRILERKAELDKEAAAAKTKDASTVTAGGKDGLFTTKSSDDSFKLRVGGYIQADGRFFLNDDPPGTYSNNFYLRRVRPVLEGTVGKYYDFRIMPDFGAATTSLQDAYLSINYWSQAKLQVGKYKEPVGLERLQSGTALLFVERALPTNLVPNRDAGVQLSGDFGSGALSYAVGYFNGVVDVGSADSNVTTNNRDAKDAAARIFAHPFKTSEVESLQGLGIGIAGTYGTEEGSTTTPNLPVYRSSGQQSPATVVAPSRQNFFAYRTSAATPANNAFADGKRIRYTPQAYYYWGPFGLMAEYVSSSQEVRQTTNFAKLTNTAEQVSVSYLITDDTASFKGVKPKKEFDPRNGSWGAVELKARYGRLTIDGEAFPIYADPTVAAREANAVAAGVNWYLSKNLKFNIDYERTTFDGGGGGSATAPLDRPTETVILERFQIVF
jgi:phosphate-selective porin OprO/OprP